MSETHRPARIGFLLSQLGSYASSLFAELTKPLGITPAEAGAIRIIGREPAISQRDLADRLGMAPSRIVALLDRLESEGLMIRVRRHRDRRVQEVSLTDAGRDLLGQLRKAAEEQERLLTDGLDDAARAELHTQLARLARLRDLDPDVHREQGAPSPDSLNADLVSPGRP